MSAGLLGAAAAWGAPAGEATAQQALPKAEHASGRGGIDAGRAALRQGVEWLAQRIDGLFGGDPPNAIGEVAQARLALGTHWREDAGFETHVRLHARFDLPNLRERAYLFFGQDNARELVHETPEAFTRKSRMLADVRALAGFAGFGLGLGELGDLRAGIKGSFEPYAQARYRYTWRTEAYRLEFRETLFWELEEGLGATTALAARRALGAHYVGVAQAAGTLSERARGLAWSLGLGVERARAPLRRLVVEAVAHGETKASNAVREYGLRARWRAPLQDDWLLGELSLGHFWPRPEEAAERRRSWAAGVGVEVQF